MMYSVELLHLRRVYVIAAPVLATSETRDTKYTQASE